MKKIYFLILLSFSGFGMYSQNIVFGDLNFKQRILIATMNENYEPVNVDANGDNEISIVEAQNPEIYRINFSNNPYTSSSGIEYFIGLRELNVYNCGLTSIDISELINLTIFSCGNDQISTLNLTGLMNLDEVNLSGSNLTSINISGSKIGVIECHNSSLTSIDASHADIGEMLFSDNPLLETANIKNGFDDYVYFANCPSLSYICADEFEIPDVLGQLSWGGNTGCTVNSYCSFTPGGVFYTIQGNNKLDQNNNGCDDLDFNIPNFKFNITNGTNSGVIIPNETGNYTIPVQSGNYTLTPILENPSYFSVSPTSAVINFPAQASPFTQDFCITPNETHPDLEITVLPINNARPGFDSHYKIIYKNNGNQTLSGTVNFQFEDAILDFVTSNQTPSSQSGSNLSWTFSDLSPFQRGEIAMIFNVNSPLETPSVNNGDILHYTASITSSQTDETPNNNIFTLNQTVVNSFDPNDKTCLEGNTITPEMVGKYVHYIIRFENTGTANAENIVVKDMIDITKFDVASLIPLDGSHSFTTKISDGNRVEFIFENIQLPFDDANNDGFVAFKIKTKPTLVTGNTFSNSASIYFDYNAPIVTNTATTAIQVLGREDFNFENYFTLFPNPASNILNIKSTQSIEISSISIYNTLGQLVLVVPSATDTIDVSALTTGNYFMKVVSDKGSTSARFVKE